MKLTDRIRNKIRSETQIADVTQRTSRLKCDLVGHVCRMPEDLSAKNSEKKAQDRKEWKGISEAFAL